MTATEVIAVALYAGIVLSVELRLRRLERWNRTTARGLNLLLRIECERQGIDPDAPEARETKP